MMTINSVITKYYSLLKSFCKNDDVVVSLGKTSEDILQDVCLTAIRKYKEKEIEEGEGLSYLKKTLFTELHFQYPRKKGEIIFYTDTLPDIAGDI